MNKYCHKLEQHRMYHTIGKVCPCVQACFGCGCPPGGDHMHYAAVDEQSPLWYCDGCLFTLVYIEGSDHTVYYSCPQENLGATETQED